MTSRPRVLVSIPHFLPGEKAGGSVRCVANVVTALSREFRFEIVTSDSDWGDRVPYRGLLRDRWLRRGGYAIRYVSSWYASPPGWIWMLRRVSPAALLVNDLFAFRYAIVPMLAARLCRRSGIPIVLIPHGQLKPSALRIKPRKKQLFLWLARRTGFYDGVLWLATSVAEREEVVAAFPHARVRVAQPFALPLSSPGRPRVRPKVPHGARLAFVARLVPNKCLHSLLEALRLVDGDVELTVAGPREDEDYAQHCERTAESLPANVRVAFVGALSHIQVQALWAEHDLFVLPTLGENFGYVIYEALLGGCPVVVGANTPWTPWLDERGGWSLEDPTNVPALRAAVQRCLDAGEADWDSRRSAAQAVAYRAVDIDAAVRSYREAFLCVINVQRSGVPTESANRRAHGNVGSP